MKVPLTPLRFLRYARDQFPNRTAIVCDEQRFTYAQFADRAARLAGALRSLGAEPGDRIAFLSTNCHRLLEAYYGVLDAGCVLLPLNVRLAPKDLIHILLESGARFVFAESRFRPLLAPLRASVPTLRRIIMLDTPEADAYDALLAQATPFEQDIAGIDEDSLAELFYTSGTSDRPKGVMLTHRNVYLHALNVIVAVQTSDSTMGYGSCRDVQLHTIPLFHANGWGAAHTTTVVGGKHVMLHQFDPEQVFRLVERERVSSMFLVPAMAIALCRSELRTQFDISSLKRIVFGGAASYPALVRETEEKLGAACASGYGMTECSPVLAFSPMKAGIELADDDRINLLATTGYPIPGVELRVVGADGNEVPKDGRTFGEVIARGDGIMAGYWRQPDATSVALKDGWLHTGDLATVDEHSYILIVDRKKDIIISGGENISSLEIEKTLISHPAVADAAVIAVPDTKWGEVPHAFVILNPGHSASEPEIVAYCRSQMAHFKCPRSVEFVDSLPRNVLGKVLKYQLRRPLQETKGQVKTEDRVGTGTLARSGGV